MCLACIMTLASFLFGFRRRVLLFLVSEMKKRNSGWGNCGSSVSAVFSAVCFLLNFGRQCNPF